MDKYELCERCGKAVEEKDLVEIKKPQHQITKMFESFTGKEPVWKTEDKMRICKACLGIWNKQDHKKSLI